MIPLSFICYTGKLRLYMYIMPRWVNNYALLSSTSVGLPLERQCLDVSLLGGRDNTWVTALVSGSIPLFSALISPLIANKHASSSTNVRGYTGRQLATTLMKIAPFSLYQDENKIKYIDRYQLFQSICTPAVR